LWSRNHIILVEPEPYRDADPALTAPSTVPKSDNQNS
jgi:hypothetical protein